MKKILFLVLFVSTLVFSQTKKVISSNIHWWGYKVAKTEASSHDGTLNLKSGSIIMKKNQVVGGVFVFDMNTISATDLSGDRKNKLDGHLKNGDFFEVEKFPTATYKITSVTKGKGNIMTVNGNLTIKGKTHAVSFPAKIESKNGVVSITSEKFSFDRQKFGISYQSTMKDVLIKDDIDMVVQVSAK